MSDTESHTAPYPAKSPVNEALLNTLLRRRSTLAKCLQAPGPNSEQLDTLLQVAHRVPDHGKLGPWRFIIFKHHARTAFGKQLGERFKQLNNDCTDKLLRFEEERLLRAPLVIAVISSPVDHKVPEWEQVLCAGAVCQNILLASDAMGFAAQWLTEWYAYDPVIAEQLGMRAHEKVAGFMYIGTRSEQPKERMRPSLEERIHIWPHRCPINAE